MESIRVFAPASVANVVCGFDVMGFAVNAPGDEVILRRSKTPGVHLIAIHGDDGKLPMDPQKNTVSASVMNLLEAVDEKGVGIGIELFKKMPVGSGLGSSAASTVAGLFAVNTLLGEPLSKQELLPFAMEGERLACGQGHADNVAPALLGGFVLIRSYEPLDVIRLHNPPELVCSLIHPHIEIQTRDARRIIKKNVPLEDAVVQWGNIAGLVAGLCREDYSLISRSMQDVIIEPIRAMLIPDFYRLKAVALEAGALGFGISGSGPSLFALSRSEEAAQEIARKVSDHLSANGIESGKYVSVINAAGPRILE